jgi:hypothetical protein
LKFGLIPEFVGRLPALAVATVVARRPKRRRYSFNADSLSCALRPLTSGRPVTNLIVTKIIEHAKAGELDPDLLCSQGLLDVATRPASGAA